MKSNNANDNKETKQPFLNDLGKIRALAMEDPNELIECALVCNEKNMPEFAMELINKAISLAGNDAAINARAYFNKGTFLTDPEEAIKCYNKTIQYDPNYALAYYNKGVCLFDLGKYEEALQCYNKALAIKPDDVSCLCNKGSILNRFGKYREALECFDKALALKESGNLDSDISPENLEIIDYMTSTKRKEVINRIEELQQVTKETEKVIESSDNSNPLVQKAITKFKALKKKEDNIVKNFASNTNDSSDTTKAKTELISPEAILKLKKEMQDLQNQLLQMQLGQKQHELALRNHGMALQNHNMVLRNHEAVLQISGTYDKAIIKQSFTDLAVDNPELYNYAKVFYWSMINYFAAYRSLSTGLILGNTDSVATQKEKLAVGGLSAVTKLAGNIPIFGGIAKGLNDIIGVVYGAVKDKRLEDRTNAITKIIMLNKDPSAQLDDEVNLCIGKAVIAITYAKAEEILNPKPVQIGKFTKTMNYINEKIEAFKAMALGEKIEIYKGQTASLAIKDLSLLLAYLYKNHENIIENQKPLDEQLSDIVIKGKTDYILIMAEESLAANYSNSPEQIIPLSYSATEKFTEPKFKGSGLKDSGFKGSYKVNEQPSKQACIKCTIFAVSEIIYDNKLDEYGNIIGGNIMSNILVAEPGKSGSQGIIQGAIQETTQGAINNSVANETNLAAMLSHIIADIQVDIQAAGLVSYNLENNYLE